MPREAALFEQAGGSPLRGYLLMRQGGGNMPPMWIERAERSRKGRHRSVARALKKGGAWRILELEDWELAYRKDGQHTAGPSRVEQRLPEPLLRSDDKWDAPRRSRLRAWPLRSWPVPFLTQGYQVGLQPAMPVRRDDLALVRNFWKSRHGPLISKRIGIQAIRQACPHFDSWLAKLEGLGSPE